MNFTVWGTVLDKLDQQWQVAEVALVFHDDLDLFEDLEDVN